MPVFYFVVQKNGKVVSEGEGLDLPDVHAAWEEATVAGGQMLRDLDGALVPGSQHSIEILDESRKPIRKLSILAEKLS